MTGFTNLIIGVPSHRALIHWEGIQVAPADTAWINDPKYPIGANAGRQPFSRVARATGTTVQFAARFDTPEATQLSALVRHNLSGTARVRRRYYADTALSTLLYDTGTVEPWSADVYPFDQCEWEDPAWWDGRYTLTERAGMAWTWPTLLPELIMPAVVVTDISDPENPAGHVEFGLDEHARGWFSSVNMDYGVETGFAFQTTSKQARGGRRIYDRRPKARFWTGVIDGLPKDEYWSKGWEMLRQYDLDRPFLVIPDPVDTRQWLRQVGMYTSVDPGAAKWIATNDFSFPFRFEEALD